MNPTHHDWVEELANSITHGLGLVLSIAGLATLVTLATIRGTAWHVVACAIYGATLVFLYTASTLYHSVRRKTIKKIFRVFDHCSIYLLIAGTYTPFLLVSLRHAGTWIWSLLALIWMLAMIGILLKAFFTGRFAVLSTLSYVAMGWIAIFLLKPLQHAISWHGFFWLLAGGLLYTFGTIFFGWERLRLSHAIWHLFVMAGSVCHFMAVLLYVLPR